MWNHIQHVPTEVHKDIRHNECMRGMREMTAWAMCSGYFADDGFDDKDGCNPIDPLRHSCEGQNMRSGERWGDSCRLLVGNTGKSVVAVWVHPQSSVRWSHAVINGHQRSLENWKTSMTWSRENWITINTPYKVTQESCLGWVVFMVSRQILINNLKVNADSILQWGMFDNSSVKNEACSASLCFPRRSEGASNHLRYALPDPMHPCMCERVGGGGGWSVAVVIHHHTHTGYVH